jgi:hypothetical protein
MSKVEETEQIQLKIFDLEMQKNEQHKNSPIKYDFDVIHDVLNVKKNRIKNSKYGAGPLEKLRDQQLVRYLEAIYNILQNLDDRLSKLEENTSGY